MTRSCRDMFLLIAVTAAIVALGTAAVQAQTFTSPTEGQIVRENVKIVVPSSAVPSDGFVAVFVGEKGAEAFTVALGRSTALVRGGSLVFLWDTKAPYHESSDLTVAKYLKDGRYSVRMEIHDLDGKTIDSQTVSIELKNKVARTNPAPGVNLVNKLAFGQTNTYRVRATAQFFDAVGLPMLGGMGISSDFRVIQSVEDARQTGEFLIRYRVADGGFVTSASTKRLLYEDEVFKPQIYRLITKRGDVVNRNMFSKQKKYSITDILPVLPDHSVKEGDAWPCKLYLKIDGLTNTIPLEGSSSLDSFEWQNGVECAKIISQVSGNTMLSMAGGKIRSATSVVNALITTYFSYKAGRMLKSEVSMLVPAVIEAGAEDLASDREAGGSNPSAAPGGRGMIPVNMSAYDDESDVARPAQGGPPATGGVAPVSTAKQGSVQINATIQLEK